MRHILHNKCALVAISATALFLTGDAVAQDIGQEVLTPEEQAELDQLRQEVGTLHEREMTYLLRLEQLEARLAVIERNQRKLGRLSGLGQSWISKSLALKRPTCGVVVDCGAVVVMGISC